MSQIISDVAGFRAWRDSLDSDARIGFVPTMGGLHRGHFALVERSLVENDVTVVSVYLNKTQFNNPDDLATYPANFEEDCAALAKLGVAVVFAPNYETMYPDDYTYRVTEDALSKRLEGQHRPGHFDGVLTVVLKLLNIVDATRAYFGEKDWQQLQLVESMVSAFFLPVQIVACPTEREESGLAMSSRNRRLSETGRGKAGMLNQVLRSAMSAEEAEAKLAKLGFEVEYVADENGRRLAAAVLEGVRLIDNLPLERLPTARDSES